MVTGKFFTLEDDNSAPILRQNSRGGGARRTSADHNHVPWSLIFYHTSFKGWRSTGDSGAFRRQNFNNFSQRPLHRINNGITASVKDGIRRGKLQNRTNKRIRLQPQERLRTAEVNDLVL